VSNVLPASSNRARVTLTKKGEKTSTPEGFDPMRGESTRRGRKGALVVLAGILIVIGFEVLHIVRWKMLVEDDFQNAAIQYANIRSLYAEHSPR
jgi:hypothetical protein